MSLQRIDTATLTKLINLCFDLSTDGGVPPEVRPQFLALGKRLRGTLVNLLSVQFDENAPRFIAAGQALKRVNAELKRTAERLDRFANTIESIGKLIGVLDDLLQIAVGFV